MASTVSEAATPATFTADQLLARLLILIKDTASAKELTIEHVSAAMQHPAQTFGPGHFGYGGKLTERWSYGLEVKKGGSTGVRLDLDFIDTTPTKSASATDICQLDFNRFAAELKAIGFAHDSVRGEHGRVVYERFQRQSLGVIVDRIGGASLPADTPTPACVRHVTVQ